jgi:hypothetical protein
MPVYNTGNMIYMLKYYLLSAPTIQVMVEIDVVKLVDFLDRQIST